MRADSLFRRRRNSRIRRRNSESARMTDGIPPRGIMQRNYGGYRAAQGKGMTVSTSTTVLQVSGVQWATEKNLVEAVLRRRPGVLSVEANPVAQTATVTYDPSRTSVAELAGWVRD